MARVLCRGDVLVRRVRLRTVHVRHCGMALVVRRFCFHGWRADGCRNGFRSFAQSWNEFAIRAEDDETNANPEEHDEVRRVCTIRRFLFDKLREANHRDAREQERPARKLRCHFQKIRSVPYLNS